MSQSNGFTDAMIESLAEYLDEQDRLRLLTNRQLVVECLNLTCTDDPVVEEMMTRLFPEWADLPDGGGH